MMASNHPANFIGASMTLTHFYRRCLGMGTILMLAACGYTSLTDAWQSPAFQRKQLDNVLVVAVTPNKTNRILFENGFLDALRREGIQATASYNVTGTSTPTKESVTAYLAKGNIQYVIVARYGGKETTVTHVPESVRTYYTGPYYPSHSGYWDRYGNTSTMTRDAYVDTRSDVILTTSVYDAKTEQLVWVGRSKSFEVNSISHAAHELADRVVKAIH
ncbi:MAG: hypothetical protein IPK95_01425 [Cellvibrionales bacterium]|jgi:hypothetical protein|nr:hypothetical protein [Cellvibrionales bacterium]